VSYIKFEMTKYVVGSLGHPISIYTPPAGSFGKRGRPDLEFTCGKFGLTFHAEMKKSSGKLSGVQAHWIEEHNLKHPYKPAIVVYGKDGVDKLMTHFKCYYKQGSTMADWVAWCNEVQENIIYA